MIRLQKFLSQAGIASRRKAEELILKGKITLNGKVVREMGVKVDPEKDQVSIQGRSVKSQNSKVYYLMYKPRGVIVSKRDPHGRKSVYDLIPNLHPSVNTVGRLDFDSEGLLLLTNDGDFSHYLMHPSSEIKKLYEVEVNVKLEAKSVRELSKGIPLEEGQTAPAKISYLREEKNKHFYSIEIHEGKKRQVRKMFEWAGAKVSRLIRLSVGPFDLEALGSRRILKLSEPEIRKMAPKLFKAFSET